MTKKEALRTLIQSSCKDIIGTGMGVRSTSDEWRTKVQNAIVVIYKDAYGHSLGPNEAFNMGLQIPDAILYKHTK